ncbi:hypothetical protein [Epilithonimonas sp.]|uniref:hypothetical protein n=1 Tax=Epilithonimonas sp. TaxID=2894511 RepID=UPI002FDEE54F
MKKNLLILLLFAFFNVFSQAYTPLLQEGNKWYVSFIDSNYDQCLYISGRSNYVYKIDGETIINGKTYKKIICDFESGPHYIRFCGDNLQGNLAALLREDINERKVYRYYPNSNTETVLYDFSVKVNDAFPTNGFDTYFLNNGAPKISAIGYGTVFNTEVKYFGIDGLSGGTNVVYEGIGNKSGLLELPFYVGISYGNLLNCFENTAGQSCNSQLVLGTSENSTEKNLTLYYSKENQDFKVLGNPSQDYKVGFYEATGRLIEERNAKGKQSFSVKNIIKNKILFYTITSQGKSWKGKIIID